MIHARCPSQFAPIISFAANNPAFHIYSICCNWVGEEPTNLTIVNIGEFNDSSLERNAVSVLQALGDMRRRKILPHIIVMHVGFGYDNYIRAKFPEVPLVGYFEWYYPDQTTYNIVRNAHIETCVDECSVCITPTRFQRSVFPARLRNRLMVVHEGVNVDYFSPPPDPLPPKDMMTITYVTRGFEPMRRFMEFIRAARLTLERMPNVRVKIAGVDRVYYTDNVKNVSLRTEADKLLINVSDRVEYLGWIPRKGIRDLLRESDLHVYFTHPFVLSWSMVEAMATGCAIVAAGEPVKEFISDGVTGWLTDPDSPEECYDTFRKVLLMPAEEKRAIQTAARATAVSLADGRRCDEKWRAIFDSLL